MRAVLVAPWPMFSCQRCGAAVQSVSAAHAQAGAIAAAARPHRNPRVSFIFSVPRESSRGRQSAKRHAREGKWRNSIREMVAVGGCERQAEPLKGARDGLECGAAA